MHDRIELEIATKRAEIDHLNQKLTEYVTQIEKSKKIEKKITDEEYKRVKTLINKLKRLSNCDLDEDVPVSDHISQQIQIKLKNIKMLENQIKSHQEKRKQQIEIAKNMKTLLSDLSIDDFKSSCLSMTLDLSLVKKYFQEVYHQDFHRETIRRMNEEIAQCKKDILSHRDSSMEIFLSIFSSSPSEHYQNVHSHGQYIANSQIHAIHSRFRVFQAQIATSESLFTPKKTLNYKAPKLPISSSEPPPPRPQILKEKYAKLKAAYAKNHDELSAIESQSAELRSASPQKLLAWFQRLQKQQNQMRENYRNEIQQSKLSLELTKKIISKRVEKLKSQ